MSRPKPRRTKARHILSGRVVDDIDENALAQASVPMPVDVALQELWAYHQLFRECGFLPDELMLVSHVVGPYGLCLGVTVQRGGEEFTVSIANTDREEVLRRWPQYVGRMTTARKEELARAFETSGVRASAPQILMAMCAKGGSFQEAVQRLGTKGMN